MSRFLTVDEASNLLRVKRQTIYKWICERKIPSISVSGRTLFDEQELLAWISSGKREISSSIRQRNNNSSFSSSTHTGVHN